MKKSLCRIVNWAQELLDEVVCAGECVVDLTAGNGNDTLALYRMVGASGQVVAFDIQPEALTNTAARLQRAGVSVQQRTPDEIVPAAAGVFLLAVSHARLADCLTRPLAGVIANLGYLPGGNQAIITKSETTLVALEQALELLRPGGRLAVVVYHEHPGGQDEADAVGRFFATLSDSVFDVLKLEVANRPAAPCLYVAEKRVNK